MAGHSQYSNRKHRKAKQDSVRASKFAGISKLITNATLTGDDYKQKEAIAIAKKQNMPKSKIEKAINKGNKIKADGGSYIDSFYCFKYCSGFFIIYATTDNKNRLISDIRAVITPKGGVVVDSSIIDVKFSKARVLKCNKSSDDFVEFALELDIEDIENFDEYTEIIVLDINFKNVIDAIKGHYKDIEIDCFLKFIPKEGYIDPENAEAEAKIISLKEAVENLEDIELVDSNFEI